MTHAAEFTFFQNILKNMHLEPIILEEPFSLRHNRLRPGPAPPDLPGHRLSPAAAAILPELRSQYDLQNLRRIFI